MSGAGHVVADAVVAGLAIAAPGPDAAPGVVLVAPGSRVALEPAR